MIKNLKKKLRGELPVTRDELIELIDSWGRRGSDEPSECYNLSRLDVSQITDISGVFRNSFFDGDISSWDTSNVTDMSGIFFGTINFNSQLPWDTLKVTDMSWMFFGAKKFNQALNFNTSNVVYMDYMFSDASAFNQPLNFDTSMVTNMSSMFNGAINFNHPLNFNTSKVIDMDYMFCDTNSFNSLLILDTSSIENNNCMLSLGKKFLDKYNDGLEIDNYKSWFKQNRDKIVALSFSKDEKEELDNFFNNIHSSNEIGLHNNIHSLPISIPRMELDCMKI